MQAVKRTLAALVVAGGLSPAFATAGVSDFDNGQNVAISSGYDLRDGQEGKIIRTSPYTSDIKFADGAILFYGNSVLKPHADVCTAQALNTLLTQRDNVYLFQKASAAFANKCDWEENRELKSVSKDELKTAAEFHRLGALIRIVEPSLKPF